MLFRYHLRDRREERYGIKHCHTQNNASNCECLGCLLVSYPPKCRHHNNNTFYLSASRHTQENKLMKKWMINKQTLLNPNIFFYGNPNLGLWQVQINGGICRCVFVQWGKKSHRYVATFTCWRWWLERDWRAKAAEARAASHSLPACYFNVLFDSIFFFHRRALRLFVYRIV